MAFVVIYDACVLYPAPLRDLLLRIAVRGIVRARWSEMILEESFRNIKAHRPDLAPGALDRTRSLMCEAVADCLVAGYEDLIDGLDLPDPADRHVLAAAIRANAQAIVTFNLKDFPDHVLARYDLEAKHPDEFLVDSIDLAPDVVLQCVREQAVSLKAPPASVDDVLNALVRLGMTGSVGLLRDLHGR